MKEQEDLNCHQLPKNIGWSCVFSFFKQVTPSNTSSAARKSYKMPTLEYALLSLLGGLSFKRCQVFVTGGASFSNSLSADVQWKASVGAALRVKTLGNAWTSWTKPNERGQFRPSRWTLTLKMRCCRNWQGGCLRSVVLIWFDRFIA